MHHDGTSPLSQGQVPAARGETSDLVNFPEDQSDESTLTQTDCPSPGDEAAERRLARLIRTYWRKAGFDVAVQVVPRDGIWAIQSDLGAGGMPSRPAARPAVTGDAPTRRRRR